MYDTSDQKNLLGTADLRHHGMMYIRRFAVVLLLALTALMPLTAQTDTIRYVRVNGSYQGSGMTWAQAKNNLQDAINDLHQYLIDNNLKSGSIYVGAGTYKPTESTESFGGGLQYTAFKVYSGIHIYGGFRADETRQEARPYLPDGSIDTLYRPLLDTLPSLESGQNAKLQPWNFRYPTILSGSHNSQPVFTFNSTHGQYVTTFPGNSYHVVWFATEGFIPVSAEGDEQNHALPLPNPAGVDGCTITGGYASDKTTADRIHAGFGGGAYMVPNSSLRNCLIYNCEAVMRGGGIYMDGGGDVDFCMIHTCQSQGVGIMQGYGGGVCIDYEGSVTRSYIVNNSSRLGGGVAICHAPDEYPWQSLDNWRETNGQQRRGEINVYSPHATACIISNNTATAEAGGLYLNDGGVGNHLTITRNNCVGTDVTYYGRRHGRSGGVYVLNGGQIYNSVVWGNRCSANNDIQFASYIAGSTEDVTDGEGNVVREGLKPKFFYSAVEKHDITDWSGVMKSSVMSLESTNTNEAANSANYPYFIGSNGKGRMIGHVGAGMNTSLPMGTIDEDYADGSVDTPDPEKVGIPRPIYWKPAAISSMAKMGLQVTDALHLSSQWIMHAHTATDLFGDLFEPMSTFGALIRREEQFGTALVSNQEKEQYLDKGYSQGSLDTYNQAVVADAQSHDVFLGTHLPDDGTEAQLPTLFVDPARNAGEKGIQIGEQGIGATWDKPVGTINDAIHYFRRCLKRIGSVSGTDTVFVYDGVSTVWYDGNGDCLYRIVSGTDTAYYKHVQILVKGFDRGAGNNATTAGIDAYLGSQLRTAAIRPTSNMRIYGGYATDAASTATSDRRPRENPTVVSADITKSGYENNSAHVLALINVRNVIIDGLRLFDGNANLNDEHSYAPIDPVTGEREAITYGGGLILNNASVEQAERIDMTGNIFRNGYIANCSAPDGAAVYVNSSNKKADGEYSRAELNILNCVIRNNTVGNGKDTIQVPGAGNAGVITARGGLAKIRMDHCDIVNNTGFAIETLEYTDNPTPVSGEDVVNENEGKVRIYNSVIYANGKVDRANRSKIEWPLSCRSASGSQNNVDGDYIYLDWDAPKPKNPAHCFPVLCRDFSDQYQKWAIRKVDMYQQTIYETGVSPQFFADSTSAAAYITAHPASGSWTWNKAVGTTDSGPVYLDYPYFDNPSRNVGHSEDGDKPMNGGIASYMPGNQNPMVNAACDESHLLWDINGIERTRGGDPDIGAIEGTHLPEKGTVLYVTPDGAGRRDGSSWNNAIAGNTVYAMSSAQAEHVSAQGDKLDEDNGTTRLINATTGNPVLTTDNRYQGGFAEDYITNFYSGEKQQVSTTNTNTIVINVYEDGIRQNTRDTLSNTINTSSTTKKTNNSSKVDSLSGVWRDDARFPYGEISGASRSLWRAKGNYTPHTADNTWLSSYTGTKDDVYLIQNQIAYISNEREENYISGLQYAVEKAAQKNKTEHNTEVQVWVGAGKYTDYKGFVMRDSVTVMGGFPAGKYASPGEEERVALMADSTTVMIPKSAQNAGLAARDYETILQVSDINPRKDSITLNPDARFYYDDDYNLTSSTYTFINKEDRQTVVHHFVQATAGATDVTSTYLYFPNFTNNNNAGPSTTKTNVNTSPNDSVLITIGQEEISGNQSCWYIKYPNKAKLVGSNYTHGNTTKYKVYTRDGSSQIEEVTGPSFWLRDGSLTGLSLWNTMQNVLAGNYQLQVDMSAIYYENAYRNDANTGVVFSVIDANGDTCAGPIVLHHNNPDQMRRYVIPITQPVSGTLTLNVSVGDGTHSTGENGADPETLANNGGNNRRYLSFAVPKLYRINTTNDYVESYSETITQNLSLDTVVVDTLVYVTKNNNSDKSRTPLRKRVLSMPDITNPVYGVSMGNPATKLADAVAHAERVPNDATYKRHSRGKQAIHPDRYYKEYNEVNWDGFTIRHGFVYDVVTAHGGGAGVCLFEGAHLKNCIITDNFYAAPKVKGGGVFCDGATAVVENCFILNNTTTRGSDIQQDQLFAGGMFLYEGTCFNSLIANNYAHGFGSVGLCVGAFYNNTVAYNKGTFSNSNSGNKKVGGVRMAVDAGNELFMANCIIYGNNGLAVDITSGSNPVAPFVNCYIQSESQITKQNFTHAILSHKEGVKDGNFGVNNLFINGVAPSAATTPFRADLNNAGEYTAGAKANNDFALQNKENSDTTCVNRGTEDFESALYTGVRHYIIRDNINLKVTDEQIKSNNYYKAVVGVTLPQNDVVYADRVQDCQVDIGAYEYDGTREIHPGFELVAFDPEQPEERELCAVYYVAESGEGLGTADSPDNAACPDKLQKVLDAAARLKLDLHRIKANNGTLPDTIYSINVALTGLITATYEDIYMDGDVKKVRRLTKDTAMSGIQHVVVKLSEGTYYPIRSTNNKMAMGMSEEVLPTRSIMVPHGVEIWGGYTNDSIDNTYDFYETYRDPLNHKTTLSGNVVNTKNNETGRAYHVLTFTNDLFNVDNSLYKENVLRSLKDRAIVDGISIENGMANGTEDEDRSGGGAVVNEYAHIRNCIVQNNEATKQGGGLYLLPASLVSGTVFTNNTAELGGGVYVVEPSEDEYAAYGSNDSVRNLAYARVYNSTLVGNSSSVRGGGMWYETNLRAKGVVLWHNTSNDMNNVAGVFDTGKEMTENNYPFAYTAVQARRLPGVNNIDLQSENSKDTRWTQNSVGDMRWRGDRAYYTSQTNTESYYYMEKLSALVRAGMPYSLYQSLRRSYPSLELRDMAGVARMKEPFDADEGNISYLKHMTFTPENKDNKFIEIGARALNFEMLPSLRRPFTRLYVANPEYVDLDNANLLLNSGDPLYSQQGSSMANPFQRFSDALDYIIDLRSSEEVTSNNRMFRDIYRDTHFEIFIAGGNYYPTHNARGEEGHARAATFLLPEGVSVVGGLDPNVYYCQAGYNFDFLQPMSGNDILNYSGTDVGSNERTDIYDADGNDITASVGVSLISSITDSIWGKRPRTDINGNNIYEPWEFLYTTTFSGETPRGVGAEDNVYHVFTCYADSSHLGALPRRFGNDDGTESHMKFTNQLDAHSSGTECAYSELHRMIIFNGVNITDGNARDLETDAVRNTRMFYRGGGLLVDGSWENGDLDSGQQLNSTGDTVDIAGYDSSDPDAKGLRDIPVIIMASQFLGNNAIQGGAVFSNGSLTILSSSFAQNFTEGPDAYENTDASQNIIKYTGGGAIAANSTVRISNTIFANNEAMLGDWSKRMSASAPGYDRQAFGGAIWGGKYSNMRLLNCDVVNNKAVSYPAVYVDHFNDANKFSVNTIYWGNRASGLEDEAVTFAGGWAAIKDLLDLNKDVYSYRTAADKDRTLELIDKRKAGTITEAETTELDAFEEHQIMFFCAYRPGFGPEPELSPGKITIPDSYNAYSQLGTNIGGTYDPREVPFLGEAVNYYSIFKGNNNINITFENEGVDGPNFVLPSAQAGKEGYNPSANWMPSRINNLTDNGWSYLTLTSDTDSGETEFRKAGGADNDHNQSGTNAWEQLPENRVGGGPYNFYAYTFTDQYHVTFMPLGEQFYMQFRNSMLNASSDSHGNMFRISSNPLLLNQEEKSYIDFGVYEYQHRSLRINQMNEVDVLWVAENENLERGNDGYSWETPTSNLQAAIETLMRSRNGHAKQVNIIKGEYKPNALLGSGDDISLSFTIQSRLMNNGALTPQTGKEYGIESLTIRGGYDPDIPDEAGYNPEKNPVVFSLARRTSTTEQQLGHIVNILDAEQYTTLIDQVEGVTSTETGHAIPITFDGITFQNTLSELSAGGAAIYYHEQTKYNQTLGAKGTTLLAPPASMECDEREENCYWIVNNKPKLTIRNCTFRNNGASELNPVSAVRVDGGGGSTFIVNSLFHNTTGNPVDAVNTVVLNCTFAQNGGHLTLRETTEDYGLDAHGDPVAMEFHSSMHNSVLWREDRLHSGATHWSITDAGGAELVLGVSDSLTFNAYSRPDNEPNPTASDVEDAKNNLIISRTNSDVLLGPNFVNPDEGNYRLYPSKRVMNTGSNETYARLVWPEYYYPDPTDKTAYEYLMRNIHMDQSTYDTLQTTIRVNDKDSLITYVVLRAHKDYDLASTARLQSTQIDRGAYECPSSGQRIIYVNPNRVSATGNETGRNWEEAYGADKLQLAIDAASIFSNNNADKKAYVFVQGNTASQGNLIVREGVDVYGSLPRGYVYQAIPVNAEVDEWEYTEAEIQAYLNRVRAARAGMAASGNTPSVISGISTVSVLAHAKNTVIDGFLITNNATPESPATTPAVDIQVPNVAVKNCLIAGNVMDDGQPVVNLLGRTDGRSLLYNSLIYGNTAGTLVNVGGNGRVLNCTLVADNAGETLIGGSNDATHVQNIIAANESAGRYQQFAPYMRPGANTYEPASYLTEHRPYWYQLIETSNQINAGNDDGVTVQNGANTIASNFAWAVNFDTDRDILGNPRRLGGRLDNGCFETWRITDNRSATNLTNGKAYGDQLKYVTDLTAADWTYDAATATEEEKETKDAIKQLYDSLINNYIAIDKADFWNENYGGNLYPHQGSVVYVMNDASLVIDTIGSSPLFTVSEPIRPGYVLVKNGGSVYGQGNALQFGYVAADKPFAEGAQYGLISMPFDCNISATQSSLPFDAYTYDIAARAAYNYEFRSEESDLWKPYDKTLQMPRTNGWLLKMSSALSAADTMRFVGWSTQGSYAYEETAGAFEKIVTLAQNDNLPSDGTAHFTKVEDMGWNLTGMPYLVSNYRTDDPFVQDDFNMHLPHILYKMNTEGKYVKNSTSYAVTSWTDEEPLSLHEGFFLQTAAIDDYEDLHYKLPVYSGPTPLRAPRHLVMMSNFDGEGDVLNVLPDEDAEKQITYTMGRDGVKWLLSDMPQLYMLAGKNSRLSFAGAAPTEIDLPLGVNIPAANDSALWDKSSLYTFSLPEPEAFEEYGYVWLIDRGQNRVVNLLQNSYTVNLTPQTDNSRFRLRIGGYPLGSPGKREYIVYTFNETLYIRGLMDGDKISIFAPTGALVKTEIVNGVSEYSTPLHHQSGYIVKVNDYGQTVINL
ncbi:MAG: right-handed parallel beta-helix repeat-containing protein [Paludibacteraceae bacterium]|nr:right-handed parallel beta-helix repeat-containing protein [Paludibacteraceae bacterium]